MPRQPITKPVPGHARLRAVRNAAGLTQVQVAARLGIAQGSYADFERGKRAASLEWLLRFAAAVGCDPSTLDARLARGPGKSND